MRNGVSELAEPIAMPSIALPSLALLPIMIALAVGFIVAPPAVGPAHAEIEYPWCAVYSEATVGATNCGFSTLAQCLATISGIGGICEPNSRYVGPVPKPKRQDRRRYDRRN